MRIRHCQSPGNKNQAAQDQEFGKQTSSEADSMSVFHSPSSSECGHQASLKFRVWGWSPFSSLIPISGLIYPSLVTAFGKRTGLPPRIRPIPCFLITKGVEKGFKKCYRVERQHVCNSVQGLWILILKSLKLNILSFLLRCLLIQAQLSQLLILKYLFISPVKYHDYCLFFPDEKPKI